MRQFDPVYSKYGAPMGRAEFTEDQSKAVRVLRVRMVDGDYDDGGAYWGGGTPLWCFRNAEFRAFTRADNKAAAVEKIRARFPRLRIAGVKP